MNRSDLKNGDLIKFVGKNTFIYQVSIKIRGRYMAKCIYTTDPSIIPLHDYVSINNLLIEEYTYLDDYDKGLLL